MPFEGAVRSRLVSWLRPWLRDEPETEIKLGFVGCQATLRDSELDPFELDNLVKASTRLELRRVTVAEITLRFNPWRSPRVHASARGIHVVLAPRDPTEGSSSIIMEDPISKEHAVSINSLDPEGALLRTILENAVKRASSGSWLRTSLMEALLQHCRLQFRDICFQLQYNEESHAFLLKAEDLTVGPSLSDTSNKRRRITSLSFLAKNESCSLMLDSTCLEFGIKENDLVKILISLKDPNIRIRLAKMDPIGFDIHFPFIDSGFSPSDFPSVLILLDIFTKPKCSRNGKLLWRIAAQRVPLLIHHPRISWYKLVSIVLLWLSYVHAYESLLSLVEYHNESIFEESFMKISSDIELKNRLQYQLRMVDELERQLPVEAAGRARHIARCRVLSTPHVDVPELTNFTTKLKNNLFLLLFFVWNFFCVLFHLMGKFMLILRNYFAHRVEKTNSSKIGVCIDSSVPQNYVSLTVSELHIGLHPTSVGHAALEANADRVGDMSLFTLSPLSLDVVSFCWSYVVNRIGSSVLMVLGAFQVHLSPSSRVPVMESDSVTGTTPSFKVPRAEIGDISQVIIRSEPAHLLHPKDSSASSQQPIAATRARILKNSLQEMWSSWKMLGQELEVDKFDWMDHPFFLFELKNFLISPGITKTVGNNLRCNMALGKVMFDLEYSSTVSLARLTRQVIDSLHWMTNITKSHDPSISDGIVKEKKAIILEKKLEYFSFRMKSAMLNIMPESNIQIGAMIAGPTINLSFPYPKDKEFIHALSSFSLDLDDIEISAWPAKQGALLALNQGSELEDPERHLWLKEPQILDIPKGQVSESFVSQGIMSHNLFMRLNSLILFFKNLEDNWRFQIFRFTFMEINASACRHYVHSFYSTENACSLSLSGMAGEADVLLYLDEICTLFQAFEGIYCMSPRMPTEFDSASFGSQDYINKCLSVKKVTKDIRMDVHEEEDTILFHRSAQFVFDADFELGPIHVVLNKSREKNFTMMKNDNATNDATSSCVKFLTCLPAYGIENFLPKSCFHISGTERRVKMLMNTAEVRSVICKPQIDDNAFSGESMIRNYNRPTEQLCEAAISSFVLHLSAGYDVSYMFEKRSAHSQITLQSVEKGACSFLPISGKGSVNQLHGSQQNLPLESIVPGFCLISEIELGQTFIADCSMKNLLSDQQSSWFQLLISSCGSSHTIKSDSQGGSCFLATSALAMFIQTLKAYSMCLSCLLSLMSKSSMRKSEKAGASIVLNDSLARPSNQDGQQYNETINYLPFSLETWTFGFLKSLDVNVSQFYVTFAVADASDGLQCLTLEVELQLASLTENLSFSLSKLTIHSKHLRKESLSKKKVNLISFSSRINNMLPTHVHCDRSKNELSGLNVTQSPIAFSEREISLNCDDMGSVSLNHLNYILKHLTASIMVKRMALSSEVAAFPSKSNWVGSGSISGFDLTLTISEIQMLLALYAPFSGKSDMKSAAGSKRTFTFPAQGLIDQSDVTIPDGAIVAIQDIRQHLYFAVEAVGEKYRVVSTVHYSLVGDQALFKVKWHQQKRSLLSLISLYAKNDSGKALRLNFLPGSRFVEISSSDDKGHALWKVIPYKHENYGDEDMEFYSSCTSLRKAFHLVNNKNNSGVAFLGGSPEFVQKPGSPFKLKVLHELTQASCAYTAQDQGNTSKKDESGHAGISSLVHMDITIDRIVFTICHAFADADDKFPLLCGFIGDVHLIGQLLPSKFRLICTYFVTLDYFYAHQNVWRKIISPVDACIFLHSRVAVKRSENIKKGMPTHCHFRIEQVDASLTELSLDILLFVAGKLNMVGPYALRSSIFCNCCKVENLTSLNLLCHFSDNQDVMVGGKQSSSVFLRHTSLVDQLPGIKTSISVSASEVGNLLTIPFHVSLKDVHALAWKTHVISQQEQDSSILFGPYLVVEVSKTKDGLSLAISPLSRIQNASEFSIELCLRTPHDTKVGPVIIHLQPGNVIDDSAPLLGDLKYPSGLKKAMMSLNEGKFLLSIKPDISGLVQPRGKSTMVEWSEDMVGGKIVPLSGIFEKLSYRFRKALGVASIKSSLSTVSCPLTVEGRHVSDIHFLIYIVGKDVPIKQALGVGDTSDSEASHFAFQKEIFISPTAQVFNLLHTNIHVVLSERYPDPSMESDDIGRNAIISCGSSAYFYANPVSIYFSITLTEFKSKCKPVNSSECVKKLQRQKTEAHYFDIKLDFGGGKYFACLRLSCGDSGVLEATVFAPYTLQNDTDVSLLCYLSGQKPLFKEENANCTSILSPEFGTFLRPRSTRSWFLKSNKVLIRLMEENASDSSLDLDTLSGFTELHLESFNEAGVNRVMKFGVSLEPCGYKVYVPAQLVHIVPRYVISNDSMEHIIIQQCDFENGSDAITEVGGGQKAILYMHPSARKRMKTSFFDSVFRKHRNIEEDSLLFIQFCLQDVGCSWSGPICISSLGRFFIKFKYRPFSSGSSVIADTEGRLTQFASVHIVEERSSLVLHFHMPPDSTLPYRIENCLHDSSITYYQKDSEEPETLGSGNSVDYVWGNLNLPHKLVVQISGVQMLREIAIDKISPWKPIFKTRQNELFTLHSPVNSFSRFHKRSYEKSRGFEVLRLGYEVYADGLKRVLRICEFADSYKGEGIPVLHERFQLRVGYMATTLLESGTQDETSVPHPLIVARLENVMLDSLSTSQRSYLCAKAKSINIDNRWQGAPFASMIRSSLLHDSFTNEDMLQFFLILHSRNSDVKQVRRFSLLLQPIDLNLDEETLMKIASFWRTSLSDAKTQGQLYYFRQFEIHPLKIKASFSPGNPDSSYSSTQEALRSLLHSVIKVPTVKNTTIELNGVLLNHALVTKKELLIKCAQHYSWYTIRAVYIAKGSSLLPPAFASIFDDAAASSLDVFFDPSFDPVNLPGLTLGMFKLISKCIDSKGFSGTKRYFGDLSKTMKKAGSNILFAAVTEISDSILRGADVGGFNGLVNGFHQGILRLAMEPSFLGAAVMQGGPDRKIILDHSPGINELYIEGYLQAMLHATYKQEYLQVKVVDNMVHLKNLPPNSSLINDIVEKVKSFLISQGLLKGEASCSSHFPSHLQHKNELKIGPMILTLCEHLFVSFSIRILRNQADRLVAGIRSSRNAGEGTGEPSRPPLAGQGSREHPSRLWAACSFVLSGMFAYVDGWLCRHIPNPLVRRIVSGFLLTFLEKKDEK